LSVSLVAVLCNSGRAAVSIMLQTGRVFLITNFAVSDGGHDPLNPNLALAPDPTLTALPSLPGDPVYTEPITSISAVSQYCVQYTCDLPAGTVTGPLSNLGLIGTWQDDLSQFLFAIANFGYRVKLSTEDTTFIVQVQG